MATCIFCTNEADSKEDMFPRWMLARVKTRQKLSRRIGDAEPVLTDDQEVRIPCVCTPCNTGWMSKLETKCKPIMVPLLEDIWHPLNRDQQKALCEWAFKTAMVNDSIQEKPFFTREDGHNFKVNNRAIPLGTAIWLGRYNGVSLSAIGSRFNLSGNGKIVVNGCVFTILTGHLILQVLSLKEVVKCSILKADLAPYAGPWESLLVQLWPNLPPKVITMPAPLHFSMSKECHHYGKLVYRWSNPNGHSIDPIVSVTPVE